MVHILTSWVEQLMTIMGIIIKMILRMVIQNFIRNLEKPLTSIFFDKKQIRNPLGPEIPLLAETSCAAQFKPYKVRRANPGPLLKKVFFSQLKNR